MKHLFTLILVSCLLQAQAQNTTLIPTTSKVIMGTSSKKTVGKDTVIESDTSKENKEPRYFYISFNTDVTVNTKGNLAKRFSPAIEFGRTYGIFDIGLATGKTNSFSSGADTSRYIEFRPTINVFSKGRF